MRIGGPASPSAAASSSSAPSVLPSSASQRAASRASASAAFRVGQVHQRPLLAALRGPEPHERSALAGQERLEVRGVGQRPRHEHLPGHARRAGVVLLQEAAEHLVVGHVPRRVEEEHVPPQHLPVAHDEQLHGRLVVLAGEGHEVQLGPGERGHLLALHRPLDRPDLVADGRRPLVQLLLGRERHLVAQSRDQRVGVALEEQLHLGDVAAVGVLRDRLDAGALAALDVVEEAGPRKRANALPDVDGAGAEREQAPDEVHRLVHGAGGRVRPEVAAAVVRELAGPLDPREVVRERDLDVRVALVVLQADVEPRLEPLDQVGLEQQGLRDGVHLGDLEVHDALDHLADPVDLAAGGLASASSCGRRWRRLCALPTYRTSPRASFIRYTPGRSGRLARVAASSGVTPPIVGHVAPARPDRHPAGPADARGHARRENERTRRRGRRVLDARGDGSPAGPPPATYFMTTKASTSTRGRPGVPTTTSLIVRVATLGQVDCHTTTRYLVVLRYRSIVPL